MNSVISRRYFSQVAATLGFGVLGVLALPTAAHSWPDKLVRVIVPAPAGSSLDVIVRSLGETLKARWGQPLIVDNKPGAGGTIGMDAVAKAAPDGYTLGIGFNGPIAFAPFMFKKLPYDPVKDLLPIVLTTSQPNVLAVPANHPANNLREFLAWAKLQGNKVSYASVGLGSSSHLSMELLKTTAGFEATMCRSMDHHPPHCRWRRVKPRRCWLSNPPCWHWCRGVA
jgi:tripartite-type tricarboxylate transporter receptor subunit TctC